MSQKRSEISSGIGSPRVRGRAELKAEFIKKLKENEGVNGNVPIDQRSAEDQRLHAKGLREYLKTSLASRKSPANTDEGSSSKTGTLEHKKGKEGKVMQAELKEHMKLTDKDIDALIKKEVLEGMKSNELPPSVVKEKKSSKKTKKKNYEEKGDEEEIVVIRLDPKLELPKKPKRVKERKSLENGVDSRDGYDSIRRDKSKSKSNKADMMDMSFEKGTLKREGADKKGEKSKLDVSKSSGKKEKKAEHKEWPKVRMIFISKKQICKNIIRYT